LVTDADRVAAFLEDAAHVPGGRAEAVAIPRDERQVAEAIRRSPRVLAIGAQSSLTGGATPRGGLVLSTARLDGFARVADRVRVGAGVTIRQLDESLRSTHAMYPPGPTWAGATVGGTIATNAAGAATFKYGTTRAWVDGLTVVLASGEVLDLRRDETRADEDGRIDIEGAGGPIRLAMPRYRMPGVPKVSAGYFAADKMDLIDLFIGSEGTLGVVTTATLRVRADRPAVLLALIASPGRDAALSLAAALREAASQAWRTSSADGLDVAAIEHMDGRSLALLREDAVDRHLGIDLDPRADMALLVTIEVAADSGADPLDRLAALLEAHSLEDRAIVALPGDRPAAERLVALREAVPLAVNRRIAGAQRALDPRIEKTAADVIVPFEHVADLLAFFDAESERRRLDVAVWGHISDGNMHANVIPRSFAEVEAGREAVLAFGREAIRLGGSPLAEHGVGRSPIKQRLMRDLYGDAGIEQMKAIKRALDPEGKLAPGVLFDAAI
jgi:D-lactate dehydrogenase (cytochrome)